jgi:hypothetical protein
MNKEEKELEVFQSFSKNCPMNIVFDSIKNQKPRKPDIICQLDSGQFIEFELVEAIDEKILRAWSNKSSFEEILLRKFKALPNNEVLRYLLTDKYVTIGVEENVTKNNFPNLIENIFKLLIQFSLNEKIDDSSRSSHSFNKKQLPNRIKGLRIDTYDIDNGPCFRLNIARHVTPNIIERLDSKFSH